MNFEPVVPYLNDFSDKMGSILLVIFLGLQTASSLLLFPFTAYLHKYSQVERKTDMKVEIDRGHGFCKKF